MYPLSYYKHNGTTTAIFTHVLLSNTPSNVVSKLLDPTAPPPPPSPNAVLCGLQLYGGDAFNMLPTWPRPLQ